MAVLDVAGGWDGATTVRVPDVAVAVATTAATRVMGATVACGSMACPPDRPTGGDEATHDADGSFCLRTTINRYSAASATRPPTVSTDRPTAAAHRKLGS